MLESMKPRQNSGSSELCCGSYINKRRHSRAYGRHDTLYAESCFCDKETGMYEHTAQYNVRTAAGRLIKETGSENMEAEMKYLTEGHLIGEAENITATASPSGLAAARSSGRILEGYVYMCDSEHNLHLRLPCMEGIIPRDEGAMGIESGETRDIALISKVNKPVCFKVMDIITDENGEKKAILSRRLAQEECMSEYISKLSPGDIIPAKVTHLEQFGAFVDIGCGIPSLVPIDVISVSRISHPSDRFSVGQDIRVIVKAFVDGKIWLTHKELLGTWEDNASRFRVGETVSGIIRSVEEYGVFVELAPNLAGLAEPKPGIRAGQCASVYIKSIVPDKMKIKLIIVDVFDHMPIQSEMRYFVSDSRIKSWQYSGNVRSGSPMRSTQVSYF